MDKKELRKKMIIERNSLKAEKHQAFSNEIFNKLIMLDEFVKANSILCYVSYANEVDTIKLIEYALVKEKIVSVPKVEGDMMQFYRIRKLTDLKKGYFGILEPFKTNNEAIDPENGFMIIPGVAFDRKMNRIGYGKGYYDRYLNDNQDKNIFKCGICFEFQLCERIETDRYDQSLDKVITEKNIYSFQ